MTFGTTDEMMASLISLWEISLCSNKSMIVIPYSSEVLCIFVVIRNVVINFSLSNTPMVMLVFPTSIASNILVLLIFCEFFSQEKYTVIHFKRFKELCLFPLHLFDF